MTGYAADTWGISGPSFLALFAGLIIVTEIIVVVLRRSVAAGSPRTGYLPDAEELAYFSGGPRQAVAAALAGLRAADAITVQPGGGLVTVGRVPPAPSALTWAVYLAVQSGRPAKRLANEPSVREPLDVIRTKLIHGGWLLSPARKRAMRSLALLMAAVAALGFARVWAGSVAGKPTTFILMLSLLAAVLAVPLLAVPSRTRTGRAGLAAQRARYLHLSPNAQPAMGLYGATGAALAVGLFGGAALWAADPALAAETELQRASMTSGSTSSDGCGGSDSGSSDSGSSCGGGGCGGGGCGG